MNTDQEALSQAGEQMAGKSNSIVGRPNQLTCRYIHLLIQPVVVDHLLFVSGVVLGAKDIVVNKFSYVFSILYIMPCHIIW